MDASHQPAREGRRIEIAGTVQGVGMRPFAWRIARECGVGGRVRNHSRGVTIDAFGTRAALDALEARLRSEHPPAARVASLSSVSIPVEDVTAFTIEASAGTDGPRVVLPPDLATCAACLAEVRDPLNRRHRYPFTNCTDCGPRFTIARSIPYDRVATTMAPFRMCAACEREYHDPADRRFHAEPNACPACGPRAWLAGPDGIERPSSDPVAGAGAALAAGLVVAVKGLGGFHLACDATSPVAVRRLRERKRREEKPLAVMVESLAGAERLASPTPEERHLLSSREAPIVLVRGRDGAGLAPEVAPGTPLVGLLLCYTPLHHLLLEAAGRPLVMTSGNLSEEPIATSNEEALRRLAGIADLFLLHDREIETRADDSVARTVASRPTWLRRSRGLVPRPVHLVRPLAAPVLACGAMLKNAPCLAGGTEATLGPHIGDLENLETLASFEAAVARLERFLRLRPAVIAHDLHPDYPSTRYALDRARADGIPAVAVQHHHAHAASAMAEHGLAGPVLALTWDGVGLGSDGTAWGGELLLARYDAFDRLATIRPLVLPGGDRAVREPWRIAMGALDAAFEGAPPDAVLAPLVAAAGASEREVEALRRMVTGALQSPRVHGVGRLFDAAGALVLSRPFARYEGQVAVALDAAAVDGEAGRYPFAIEERAGPGPAEIDWRPALRALAGDLQRGTPPAQVSARFHRGLATAAAGAVRAAARVHGRLPVVLTGGVFQNARLAGLVREELTPRFEVYLHSEVPPGDGGVALGQAVVAGALARS